MLGDDDIPATTSVATYQKTMDADVGVAGMEDGFWRRKSAKQSGQAASIVNVASFVAGRGHSRSHGVELSSRLYGRSP